MTPYVKVPCWKCGEVGFFKGQHYSKEINPGLTEVIIVEGGPCPRCQGKGYIVCEVKTE